MALPLTGVETTVEVVGELISKPYIEITLAIMARFGVSVVRDGWQRFTVPAGSRYRSPGIVYVEGDASSASYFLALGAIGGGPVRVEGVGRDSIQGDVRFADALALMGARHRNGAELDRRRLRPGVALQRLNTRLQPYSRCGDDAGDDGVVRRGTDDADATSPAGGSRKPIASRRWRPNCANSGAESRKGATLFASFRPRNPLSPPGGIDTYDDHRIAMCFSLAAFGTPLRINDPKCVAKTFPDYFERFAAVTRPVPVIAIDGPSASGKGTVAARVAAALGWHYLDSGALYRLTALAAQRAGVAWDETKQVSRPLQPDWMSCSRRNRSCLAGEEVGEAIRTRGNVVGRFASRAPCRRYGRRCCSGSGCSAGRLVWWRTGATWRRSFFPMRRPRFSSQRVSRCAPKDAISS